MALTLDNDLGHGHYNLTLTLNEPSDLNFKLTLSLTFQVDLGLDLFKLILNFTLTRQAVFVLGIFSLQKIRVR